MVASDQTDLNSCFSFHIVFICFGGCVVESVWLQDLAPCHACTQTPQNWSFEVERKEKSMDESSHRHPCLQVIKQQQILSIPAADTFCKYDSLVLHSIFLQIHRFTEYSELEGPHKYKLFYISHLPFYDDNFCFGKKYWPLLFQKWILDIHFPRSGYGNQDPGGTCISITQPPVAGEYSDELVLGGMLENAVLPLVQATVG